MINISCLVDGNRIGNKIKILPIYPFVKRKDYHLFFLFFFTPYFKIMFNKKLQLSDTQDDIKISETKNYNRQNTLYHASIHLKREKTL